LLYTDLISLGDGRSWDNFCQNDDGKSHCKVNSNRNMDVTCQCSYSKQKIKRVVFEYIDDNVAVTLNGSGSAFEKIVVQTQFMKNTRGRPFVLTSVSNSYFREAVVFNRSDNIYSDSYYFHVGTLDNLTKAGLGL
jgi:hypothetical protein